MNQALMLLLMFILLLANLWAFRDMLETSTTFKKVLQQFFYYKHEKEDT